MNIKFFIISLIFFIAINTANAENVIVPSYSVSAGIMDYRNDSGLNLNSAIELNYKNFIANFNFIDLLITKEDNERYYMDTFSNGQSRCRDRTNGQFAKTEKCDPTYDYNFNFSCGLNYLITNNNKSIMLGGGLFRDNDIESFFSIGYLSKKINSSLFFKGEIGKDLTRGYIGISF